MPVRSIRHLLCVFLGVRIICVIELMRRFIMAFCTKCGNKLDPNDKFCGACGAPVKDPEETCVAPVADDMTNDPETSEVEQSPTEEDAGTSEEKEPVYGAVFDNDFYKEAVSDTQNLSIEKYYRSGQVVSVVALALSFLALGSSMLSLVFMKAGMIYGDLIFTFLCLLACLAGIPLLIIGLILNKRAFNNKMKAVSLIAFALTFIAFVILVLIIPKF